MVKTKFLPGPAVNFFLFCAFGAGIVSGRALSWPGVYAAGFFILAGLVYFLSRRFRVFAADSLLIGLFFLAGTIWALPLCLQESADLLPGPCLALVKIGSLPQDGKRFNSFKARVLSLDGRPAGREVTVRDFSRGMEYRRTYWVRASLHRRSLGQGDFYFLSVKTDGVISSLPVGFLDRLCRGALEKSLAVFRRYLDPYSAGFAASVYLGRRELFDQGWPVFRDAGIAHLVAISGSNIALIAVTVIAALRFFYVRRVLAHIAALAAVTFYAAFTGFNPPVARAWVMYLVFCLTFLVKKPVNVFNSLGLAGLVCLLIDPGWLFDASFQLSFVCVLGLGLGWGLFPRPAVTWRPLAFARDALFVSFWATLFVTPLGAYYFGRIYCLSILHNVMLVPWFSFISVMLTGLLATAPFPVMGEPLAAAIDWMIFLFMSAARFLGGVPGTFFACRFNAVAVGLYYCLLFAALWGLTRPMPSGIVDEMKRKNIVVLLVLGLLAASSGCAGAPPKKDDKVLAAESHAKYLKAMAFYDKAQYGAAIGRLQQLVKLYPTQDDAADAQYYIGRSFEAVKDPFPAFKAYEAAIEKYPNSHKITEMIKRQYDIGQAYLAKTHSRWVYTFISHPAVEVFSTIGDKSPYSEYADQAYYQAGMLLMRLRDYDKAKEVLTKIVDNYPRSEWYVAAKYQVAMSVAEGFRGSDYDAMMVEDAIEKFEDFLKTAPADSDIAAKAEQKLNFLKEQMAKKSFDTAMFYWRQHKCQSAGLYFKQVLDRYPDTAYARSAKEQLAHLPEE